MGEMGEVAVLTFLGEFVSPLSIAKNWSDLFYEVIEYDPVGHCIKILYSFKYFNRQSLLFLDANSWIDFIDCI